MPARRPALWGRLFTPRILANSLLLTGIGLLLLACSFARPRRLPYDLPVLRAREQSRVEHDGITLDVQPVTLENAAIYPELRPTVTFHFDPRSPAKVETAAVPITPLPIFRVEVANHTGHVVRFTRTMFRLEDDLQRRFQIFGGAAELASWAQQWVARHRPELATDPLAAGAIQQAVGSLPLLNRNVELLDGDVWVGWLAFNLNVSDWEASHLGMLQGVRRLRVRIAEVPVELDASGEPSRTAEFDLHFDRATSSRGAMCPPSIESATIPGCELMDEAAGAAPIETSTRAEPTASPAATGRQARPAYGPCDAPEAQDAPTRECVRARLSALRDDVRNCGDGRGVEVSVAFVFSPDGAPTSVTAGPPIAGTPLALCVEAVARNARMPPFRRDAFTVTYPFSLR